MKNIFLCALLLSSCTSNCYSQNWLWAKSAAGVAHESVHSVSADAAGNVFATGYFYSPTIIFDSTTLTNAGSYDVFIAKYDDVGNMLWAVSAGGTSGDEGLSISADVFGNAFVTGWFYSPSITFGSTTLTNGDASGNSAEIFIVKIDANGNVLWAKSVGGIKDDLGFSVSTDAVGNVFVTGRFFSSTINFDSNSLSNADASGFSEDIFIAKYDMNGNVLWAKSAGGTGNDEGYSVSADASGAVFVTGLFSSSTIIFGSTTLTNTNPPRIAFFIVKYDINGNALWAKTAGGTPWGSSGFSISADPLGNAFVAGCFSTSIISGSTIIFGSTMFTSAGADDVFVVKYDSTGNVLWAKKAGGLQTDVGRSVSTDANGNAFVTGSFSGNSITFDSNTLIPPPDNCVSGCDPMFIVKYNPNGDVLCASALASSGASQNSVSADPFGNAYIGGDFRANSFTVGIDTLPLTDYLNAFVAKHVCDCSIMASISGNTTVCRADSITLNAFGGTKYLWNTGATTSTIIISPSANSTYSVSVSIGMCEDDTNTFVTIKSLPSVSLSINPDTVCMNTGAYPLSGGSPSGGTYSGTGVSGGNFNPSTAGSGLHNIIYVYTSDTNDCSNSDTVQIFVDVCTGINQLTNSDFQIAINPNPSSGIFIVDLRNSQGAKICVYDVLGNCLLTKDCRNDVSPKIDLSAHPKGIYFMEIVSDGERAVKKIVLQ